MSKCQKRASENWDWRCGFFHPKHVKGQSEYLKMKCIYIYNKIGFCNPPRPWTQFRIATECWKKLICDNLCVFFCKKSVTYPSICFHSFLLNHFTPKKRWIKWRYINESNQSIKWKKNTPERWMVRVWWFQPILKSRDPQGWAKLEASHERFSWLGCDSVNLWSGRNQVRVDLLGKNMANNEFCINYR